MSSKVCVSSQCLASICIWCIAQTHIRGCNVTKLPPGIWLTAPDWSVQKLVMQIVLDPLSHFENYTHQAILVKEGLAR